MIRRHKSVTASLLARHPLPMPGEDADKHARGIALVIGGSEEIPGAVVLAGTGALRSGAGVLQIATAHRMTAHVGLAVPEALVMAIPTTRRSAPLFRSRVGEADAVLVGCGMSARVATRAFLRSLRTMLGDEATLVVDAAALNVLRDEPDLLLPLAGRSILTPHAGEMATLLDIDKASVEREPWNVALLAAERFHATVALKGSETWIASPIGELARYRGGGIGLGTSGSGDVLGGIIAGCSARGAAPFESAMWGVWLHGEAGRVLSRRVGHIGFLARELLVEIPGLL